MKRIVSFFLSLGIMASLIGCAQNASFQPDTASSIAVSSAGTEQQGESASSEPGQAAASPVQQEVIIPEYSTVEYDVPFLCEIESDTIQELQQPCTEQGTVVTLDYEVPAYAINTIKGTDITLEKSVTVYLPYGYDETQPYDVLYLLHGTGGDHTYWLQGKKTGATTCNLLDNMIQRGLCKPVIVVTPNYYGNAKGQDYKLTDEECIAYGESVQDSYLLCANDVWTQFFQKELRETIIPLIESNFSTYANGDTSEESLAGSRDHRAIAGLSRGAMTVVRSGIMSNLDYFSYFGSFSGTWTEFEKFEDTLNSSDYIGYPIHYWYNGNGTEDFSIENHILFWNEVKEKLSTRFVDGENMAMVVKEGASHSYENWITDLYNMLLVSFAK